MLVSPNLATTCSPGNARAQLCPHSHIYVSLNLRNGRCNFLSKQPIDYLNRIKLGLRVKLVLLRFSARLRGVGTVGLGCQSRQQLCRKTDIEGQTGKSCHNKKKHRCETLIMSKKWDSWICMIEAERSLSAYASHVSPCPDRWRQSTTRRRKRLSPRTGWASPASERWGQRISFNSVFYTTVSSLGLTLGRTCERWSPVQHWLVKNWWCTVRHRFLLLV